MTMRSQAVRPVRGLPGWAALCLVAGAAAVVWWASGLPGVYEGPDHMVGPYQVPVALEYAVGGVALATALAVLVARPAPRAARGLSSPTVGLVVIAGVVLALSWRVMTHGGDGANIGGGLLAIVGPFGVAGLLVAAVCVERRARAGALRLFWLWLGLSLLSAPVLATGAWWLSR